MGRADLVAYDLCVDADDEHLGTAHMLLLHVLESQVRQRRVQHLSLGLVSLLDCLPVASQRCPVLPA